VAKRCALCATVSVEDALEGAQALDALSVAAPRAVRGMPHAPLDLALALADTLVIDAAEARCAACGRAGGVELATYAPCVGEGVPGPLLLPIQIRRLQGDAAWGAGSDAVAAGADGGVDGVPETAEATAATVTAEASATATSSPRPGTASSGRRLTTQTPSISDPVAASISEARGVVRIPDALTLPPPEWAAVADASAALPPRAFSLAAVVTHTAINFGDAAFGRDAETSGHYIAYVRTDDGSE
jgi:hypothetical protein